jgi:hypothetical protein
MLRRKCLLPLAGIRTRIPRSCTPSLVTTLSRFIILPIWRPQKCASLKFVRQKTVKKFLDVVLRRLGARYQETLRNNCLFHQGLLNNYELLLTPCENLGEQLLRWGLSELFCLCGLLGLRIFWINCMPLTSNAFLCSVDRDSSVGRATGYGLDGRGSYLDGVEFLRQEELWGPPSLLYKRCRIILGGSTVRVLLWPPTPYGSGC